MLRTTKVLCVVMLLLFVLLGCSENRQTLVAPETQGGTESLGRVVYEGTADSHNHVLEIPEINLDDMPMLSVYVATSNLPPQAFTQLPFEDRFYTFQQGVIEIIGCSGLPYMVVIAK